MATISVSGQSGWSLDISPNGQELAGRYFFKLLENKSTISYSYPFYVEISQSVTMRVLASGEGMISILDSGLDGFSYDLIFRLGDCGGTVKICCRKNVACWVTSYKNS